MGNNPDLIATKKFTTTGFALGQQAAPFPILGIDRAADHDQLSDLFYHFPGCGTDVFGSRSP
jgi:hypothetical protein